MRIVTVVVASALNNSAALCGINGKHYTGSTDIVFVFASHNTPLSAADS
jgi:hypothetical protein